MNLHFTEEAMWVANKHMKNCSELWVSREIIVKTTGGTETQLSECKKLKTPTMENLSEKV